MAEVSIIGTGRVGSLLLQYLVPNNSIKRVNLVNRKKNTSEGVFLDTVNAFPKDFNKIKISDPEETRNSDVIVICSGATMQPGQHPLEVVEKNEKIIEDIVEKIEIRDDSVLIALATQVDIITSHLQKISQHSKNKVIGFGGAIDVARLKYILNKETGKYPEKCYFIGEHGKRGISVFDEKVKDKEKIDENTKNYLHVILEKLGFSYNFGTAKLLAQLVDCIVKDKKEELCVSCFHPKYGMYLTWPAVIGKKGVEKIVDLRLKYEEQKKLAELLESKKKEKKK